MAAINFTPEQQRAIYTNNTNILVSAGAGSGKTAVLSERVVEKIKQGIPLESLIVLTFTNAAAKEMHLRIRKKLQNLPNNTYAKEALKSIDAANIQTFDSFALNILKRFGYDLNISPNASIMDTLSASLLKKTIVDSLFNRYYEEKNQAFLTYVKTFENKRDDALKNQIIAYHQALSMHANFSELLDFYTDNFFTKDHFNQLFNLVRSQIKVYQTALKETLSNLLTNLSHEAALEYANLLYEAYKGIFAEENFNQLVKNYKALSLPSSSTTSRKLNSDGASYDKALLDQVKKTAKTISAKLDPYLTKSLEDHTDDFLKSAHHIPIIKTLILGLEDALIKTQMRLDQYEFSTVARLAYKIIKENPNIQQTLKDSIHEVMIDEYQDTSSMQESFIQLITDQNVYQVGDIKQSIYRFRHAEPKLFTQKYNHYASSKQGLVIDLNQNFRSRKEVLFAINTIFKPLMDEAIGGILYDEAQALKFGNETYTKYQDTNTNYGLELHEIILEEPIKDLAYNQDEIELFHIAKDILNTVNHAKIYDESIKTLRPVKFSDITILVNVSTRFDLIKKILEYHKIPVSISRSEAFIDYYDMDLYRHLFKLIHALKDEAYYEETFKHSFLSVLRSYAFQIDDDTIVKNALRLPNKLRDFSLNLLTHEVKEIFEVIEELARLSQESSLNTLWETLIKRFNLYEKSIHLEDTERVLLRMNHLSHMINDLTLQGKTLPFLVTYFDDIKEEGLDIEFEPRGMHEGDTVLLMTIHKSKGLEFPIVYLPHLNHRFNRSNLSKFDFDLTLGFLMPFEDEGLNKSCLYALKNDMDLKEDLSERLRVLYVALSRAKDKLIVPIIPKETEFIVQYDKQDIMLEGDRLLGIKTYHDIFLFLKDRLKNHTKRILANTLSLNKDYLYHQTLTPYESEVYLDKNYQSYTPKETTLKDQSFSAKITELLTKESLESVAFGNLMHGYFELINFKEDPFPQIEALAIEPSHKALLKSFFSQDLIKSLTIINAYKEFPFALTTEESTLTGYIDLLLETKDAFIIIDYKLKNIDKEAYVDQLKGYESILKTISDKKVIAYLYSILDKRFKKILG